MRLTRFDASILIALALVACATPTAPATPPAPLPTPIAAASATPASRGPVTLRPISGGPTVTLEGIRVRRLAAVGAGNLRIVHDARSNALLMLGATNDIFTVSLDGAPAQKTRLYSASEIGIPKGGTASGMRMGPDGTLFVAYNAKPTALTTQATVRKGALASGGARAWSTLFKTSEYQASNTNFDHLVNGIAISPDGKTVLVNTGSRTDHGEIETAAGNYPKLRDVPLTAKILRVPADAQDLVLPNDDAQLRAGGWVYADGTRNAYDLAYAPNGDVFGVDNGPDADFPDELNWLREGRHYGFPWRFGTEANPQQFPAYDSTTDKRLSDDFVAVKNGTYRNDPGFPLPAAAFADPVINHGPSAAQYRAADGSAHDAAAEGVPLGTFTPHRSPLGLVFASSAEVPADLRSTSTTLGLFVASWGAGGGNLTDKGQDVVHMSLSKAGDNYEAITRQVARDLKRPIDMALAGNKLYVLEYEGDAAIWEFTLN